MALRGLWRSHDCHMIPSTNIIKQHCKDNSLHSLSNIVRCDTSAVKLPRPAELTPARLTMYSVPFIRFDKGYSRVEGVVMLASVTAEELPVLYRTTQDVMGVTRGSLAGG